jgi:trehalose-6-phosphate synthase
LTVNPYDRDELAAKLLQALALPAAERRARMRSLRAIVQTQDAEHWLRDLLGAASSLPSSLARISQRSSQQTTQPTS